MLHTVTFRALVVAACGWLVVADAAALSLGRARGAVLVGRPLELTIPATLDTTEGDTCASAEVFYGEQRITRTPSVRWEPGRDKEGVLRVSSELPVDEPMVTVYLRVGCSQPSTRKYVMLAEVPPEEASVNPGRAAPRSVPIVPSTPAAAPAAPPAPAAAPAPRIAAAARPAAPASAAPAPAVRRPTASLRTRPEQPKQPARPVLKLEPLDLSIDHSPTLRMSAEIGTQPTLDAGKRQAAAALWQALQKPPEEALQDAQRLRSLQGELQSVREATRQNAAAVAEMRAQVEQAQGERSTASLLALVLAALLAAVLAVLGWRWYRVHRVERVGRWFEAHGNPQAAAVAREPAVDLVVEAVPVPVTAPVPAAAPAPASRAAIVPTTAPIPLPDFQPSRGAAIRMVGVEELLDVHDKADFFLSIGEVDQAVAVLEAHVHDQVDTSALPWMDLLELYHSLGRRADFDRLRGEFRQRFSAQVPDFDHFDQPTPTLENYGRALSRIVALWPTRRVLDAIEESIFRKPGLPGSESFSLEAYRELVLLYHIATDIAPVEEAEAHPPRITSFSDTSLQPLHDLDAPERPRPDVDLLLVPPASPNVGVDIDVTAAEEDEPETLPPLDFDLDPRQDDAPDPGRGRS